MFKVPIEKKRGNGIYILRFMKKHISYLFYGAVIFWLLAFLFFILCAVAPTYPLLRLCNILLLITFVAAVCFSAVFNFLYFLYNPGSPGDDKSDE